MVPCAPLPANAAWLHAGGAGADAGAIEHDHRADPAFAQVERDRKAGDAGADDRNFDLSHTVSAITASSSASR